MASKDAPSTGQPSRDAIRHLVEAGRQKFNDYFGESQLFEDVRWEVGPLQHRMMSKENLGLYFTCHGSTREALPAAYADVVKSWVLLAKSHLTAGHMRKNVSAARILWAALQQRRDLKEPTFYWNSPARKT